MNKLPKSTIPRIVKAMVPTTAIASSLLAPAASGAPGDLDPTFGDMGRSALPLIGAAWTAEPLPGDESLLGGGEHYYNFYYGDYFDGFIGHVSGTGSVKSTAMLDILKTTEVLDIALQNNGMVVAVGRTETGRDSSLIVFRLDAFSALDSTFGDGGVIRYPDASAARSVVLDPNGAIVVAGLSGGNLTVLRWLGNGTLDPAFASAGVFIGPPSIYGLTSIVRTAAGGYRIGTTFLDGSQAVQCRVVALTASGVIDDTFGSAGIATLSPPPGASLDCLSMIAQGDGSLLLAGQESANGLVTGFATRMLASGSPDPSFVASPVHDAMTGATALAVDAAGDVLVAGLPPAGVPGTVIVSLHANGTLNDLFGNAGSTWIDVASPASSFPVIHDMRVLADGRVLAAGERRDGGGTERPLLVRLLGTAGTAGPGVIGLSPSQLEVKESSQKAVVTVRRMGGAAGEVSVTYRTGDYTGTDAAKATSNQDYSPISGQLTWADGDRTDRQIVVPIAVDSGTVEEAERFMVTLTDPQGGAEVGTRDAIVEILGDGDPVGQFGFADSAVTVSEADAGVQLVVNRNYYSKGATSVTLTPVTGSATAADLSTAPITLSWADGDSQPKAAVIPITKDQIAESTETFTVKLSNPTNGALIGPHSVVTVSIQDSPPPSSGSGGGGAIDGFALAVLGALRWLRRRAYWPTLG